MKLIKGILLSFFTIIISLGLVGCSTTYEILAHDEVYTLHNEYKVNILEIQENDAIEVKFNEIEEKTSMQAKNNYHFVSITLKIDRMEIINPSSTHQLDEDDFKLKNLLGLSTQKAFPTTKAIIDHSWYGHEIQQNESYTFILHFEIEEKLKLDNTKMYLELDFVTGFGSQGSNGLNIELNKRV